MFKFGRKSYLNSTRSTGTNHTNRGISCNQLNSIP